MRKFAVDRPLEHCRERLFGIPSVLLFSSNMSINEDSKTQDEQLMRKALAEARLALAAGEVPIGAVIACNGRVIARAHNLTEQLCDVTAHAEMQAITTAANQIGGKYLTHCTHYVTVEP